MRRWSLDENRRDPSERLTPEVRKRPRTGEDPTVRGGLGPSQSGEAPKGAAASVGTEHAYGRRSESRRSSLAAAGPVKIARSSQFGDAPRSPAPVSASVGDPVSSSPEVITRANGPRPLKSDTDKAAPAELRCMRAFRLAYDGTGYRGFQRQPHGETVEDALLGALAALDVDLAGDVPPGYAAAGRTDAGVSARAQTVAFEAPAWLTPRALNGELPADVRAWAHADVADDFHATRDADERTYRYFLHAREANGGRSGDARGDEGGVSDERARAVARQLSGRRDFHNLTPDDRGTVRELTVEVERDGAFLVVDCRAGGFARELVRRLVTLLEAVATGARDLAFVDRALAEEPLTGPDGIAPAAPEPLVLLDVRYPGATFVRDDEAAASARAVFEARRRERLAGARVAGELSADGADP